MIDTNFRILEMREGLKNFYAVLKGQDANLQFVFMTGVTKFSKVSLFSGVNQLTDITISYCLSPKTGFSATIGSRQEARRSC